MPEWFAILLMAFGLTLCGINWILLVRGLFRRSPSMTPLLPAALLAAGLFLHPETREFWWLALLADPTIPLLPPALFMTAVWEWRISRVTRIACLVADDGVWRVRITLHRGGYFRLLGKKQMQPGQFGLTGCSNIGRFLQLSDGRLRCSDLYGREQFELVPTIRSGAYMMNSPAAEADTQNYPAAEFSAMRFYSVGIAPSTLESPK
jgi:hypothetical protein